jgi:uncharacterized membrane protein YkvA (DUF1232 family)
MAASLRSRHAHLISLADFGFFSLGEDDRMMAFDNASDLRNAALGRDISLARLAEWEKRVRNDFWSKIRRLAGKLPFVEELVAAYYCALDPATPMRVRGMLLAAIAYFILPFDFVPDIIVGLGFADDAALVTAVIAMVSAHITPTHRAAAARALDKELPKTT